MCVYEFPIRNAWEGCGLLARQKKMKRLPMCAGPNILLFVCFIHTLLNCVEERATRVLIVPIRGLPKHSDSGIWYGYDIHRG